MAESRTTPLTPLSVLPTWDQLFANPALFRSLPAGAQDALYQHVAMMEVQLRLARESRRSHPVPSEPDRLLLIEEAANLLATSVDTLYTKWQKLSFAFKDPLDGKIKFRQSGIEQYIRARAARTTS